MAWLVYSVPHLVYHARHIDVYDSSDQLLNLSALGGAVVLSATAFALSFRGTPTPSTEPDQRR